MQTNGGNNEPNFLNWLYSKIDDIDKALSENDENHLSINFIIDLHSAPGGRNSRGDFELYYNEELSQTFFKAWERLATHLKGRQGIWAYDLINEPLQSCPAPEERDYLSLQYEAAKRIRQIGNSMPIIIESNRWDNPTTFNYLSPIPLDDIIYEVHMYIPHSFTHQNVGTGMKWTDEKCSSYPGLIDGKNYNREVLEENLRPTIEFHINYSYDVIFDNYE